MTASVPIAALPFPVVASDPGVWRQGAASGEVIARAPGHTDFYVNPGGDEAGDAASMLNATTLLGTPALGDFQFSARVRADFASQYDAGVLLIWIDEHHWAKLCFEFSPAAEPMVVSVVTRDVSDDANAFVVDGRSVWLRISRLGRAYAFHASTDAEDWRLVRVFTFDDDRVGDHQIGFEAQSPTGDGCIVTFDDIGFIAARLGDLRDGS